MIMATFGNTSFIGFSYIDAFYGQDYIVYGVIYDIFGSFLLLVSVGMIIITWGSGRKNSILNISKSIFLFPPMIIFFITIFAKNFEVPKIELLYLTDFREFFRFPILFLLHQILLLIYEFGIVI